MSSSREHSEHLVIVEPNRAILHLITTTFQEFFAKHSTPIEIQTAVSLRDVQMDSENSQRIFVLGGSVGNELPSEIDAARIFRYDYVRQPDTPPEVRIIEELTDIDLMALAILEYIRS